MNLDKSVDNILFERYVPCTIWCDPWPSWVVGYFGASWGSFFLFCWSSSLSWLWLLPLITGACCRNSWPLLPHKIAEVEQGACFFSLASALVCMCVCECVLCWQDLTKTAYVVEGDDLLPLLGRLQEELYVRPRGEWHISLWAAKTSL